MFIARYEFKCYSTKMLMILVCVCPYSLNARMDVTAHVTLCTTSKQNINNYITLAH